VRSPDVPNLHRLLAGLLLLLASPQDTDARADSVEWVAAKRRSQQIQTQTPALSRDERRRARTPIPDMPPRQLPRVAKLSAGGTLAFRKLHLVSRPISWGKTTGLRMRVRVP
jgi:hypothetical protein